MCLLLKVDINDYFYFYFDDKNNDLNNTNLIKINKYFILN